MTTQLGKDGQTRSAIIQISDDSCKLQGYIVIDHSAGRLPAFGATRIWNYTSLDDAYVDALELARTMSKKAAISDIACAGAKAVLLEPPTGMRVEMLNRYVEYVNMLGGSFITGADVGVGMHDLELMADKCSHIVGTQTDPVYWTVQGVLLCISETLRILYDNDSIAGRSFAVQGLGKTGATLVERLVAKGAKNVYVSDIDEEKVNAIATGSSGIVPVPSHDIHMQQVDIFSPCALSHVLSDDTVDDIRAKAVVGSANNQLGTTQAAVKLHDRGVLYAPDYVVNAGGIIAVYHEHSQPHVDNDMIGQSVETIGKTLRHIFEESQRRNQSPAVVADEIAINRIQQMMDT